MLSICIPIYNFNVVPLVRVLHEQCEAEGIDYEIILIDDASTTYKSTNEAFCTSFHYIPLKENIGRSKIRNLFLGYAKFEYLLFLDCDAIIANDSFISSYTKAIRRQPNVICGGRIYESEKADRAHRLRWKYGIEKESQSALQRQQLPNKSFMTNNFVIRKSLLETIKFDERIGKYGHEDTLFGFELKKREIVIEHIENPVVNGDVETNSLFLQKTDEGVINLVKILNFVEDPEALVEDITLLRFHQKVKSFDGFIAFLFLLFGTLIRKILEKGYVHLALFDFYKLGLFVQNRREK